MRQFWQDLIAICWMLPRQVGTCVIKDNSLAEPLGEERATDAPANHGSSRQAVFFADQVRPSHSVHLTSIVLACCPMSHSTNAGASPQV